MLIIYGEKVVGILHTMEEGLTIFEMVRDARCAKGVTQSKLAGLVGCRQSAISMFESGRADAISQKTLSAIAGELGLDAKALSAMDLRRVTARSLLLKYCAVDDCPSNVPYTVRGRIRFSPAMVEAPAGEQTRCSLCGDILEDRCPNEDCRAELNEGAFCGQCGTAYVSSVREKPDNADERAATIRARISELRAMSQTKRFVHRGAAATVPRGDGKDEPKSGGKNNVEKST